MGILQTWLPTLLEVFIIVQLRKKGEFIQGIITKFECDTLQTKISPPIGR